MASGNETSGNCGPTSGNCGPDFEWEYVPIPLEDTDDKKAVEVKSEVKGNLPSVEDMEGIPEDIEDLFDRHGDDLMIDNSGHIYSLWKETGGMNKEKHYTLRLQLAT